jgi:ABC-type sugar transport system substrate-binding protein
MTTKLALTATGMAMLALTAGALTACGSSGSGGSGAASKKSLELIVGTKSDNFYVTMECGAEQEAKKLGVKLTVQHPPAEAADRRRRGKQAGCPHRGPDGRQVSQL